MQSDTNAERLYRECNENVILDQKNTERRNFAIDFIISSQNTFSTELYFIVEVILIHLFKKLSLNYTIKYMIY